MTVNPHRGVNADLFPTLSKRPSVGPGWDVFFERMRQLNRPALGLICAVALADQFIFAGMFRQGAGRLDIGSLCVLATIALALAGLRGIELGAFRINGNGTAPA